LARLRERAHRAQGAAFWPQADGTPFFSWGRSAVVETTALATQALLRDGKDSALPDEALKWLFQQGDAFGTWWATQPTAQTLRAVLMSAGRGTSENAAGVVRARLGAETLTLTVDNASRDLLQQRRFQVPLPEPGAKLALSHDGPGALQYQALIRSIHPWQAVGEAPEDSPFRLKVEYDRTKARRNDLLTATVTAVNRKSDRADMVMIELGLPPGAEPLEEDLRQLTGEDEEGRREREPSQAADGAGEVTKYEKQPGRIILYMDGLAPRQSFSLKLRLRVRFAIEAKTLPSRIYAYYNPERFALAPPEEISVRYGS
jgi:hypothetical protein